jgi:hypothetical protein
LRLNFHLSILGSVKPRRADEAAVVPEARCAPEVDDELDSDAEPAPPGPEPAAPPGLDERGRQILDFEQRWWRHAGAKEQAIRDTFGLSATRYYQLLNALLDEPAAVEYDPGLVRRLRRLRSSRTRRP